MKRVALFTIVVLATLAFVGLLWVFRFAVVLFLMSLFLTAALRPLTDAFNLRLINRTTALIIVYVVAIILLVLVLSAISAAAIRELEALTHQVSVGYETIYNTWPNGTQLQQAVAGRLPASEQLYELYNQEGINVVAQAFLGVTSGLGAFIAAFFLIIILSIYWSTDRVRFERLWLSLLPAESRSRARNIWRDIEDRIGAYLRSELVRGVLAGLLIGGGLYLLDVRYATLLAIAAAVLSLIPWLGVVLIALPVLLAGSTAGLTMGILGVVFTIVILILLELYVQPLFFSTQRFSSLLMVILAFILADSLGLIAILAAPPLTAAIQLFFWHMRETEPDLLPLKSVRRIADLRARLEQIHGIAAEAEEELSPRSENMLARLDALVVEANELIEKEGQS